MMAPISDKRSQPQPLIKENSHNHSHTKENASSAKHNKKGLEILDFHESWLEEMEIYKDKLYVQKHQQHQLLGSHNHVHTPQGCQLDSYTNSNGITTNSIQNVVSNTSPNTNTNTTTANHFETKSPKRRVSTDHSTHKARITVRTAIAPTSSPDAKQQNGNVQVSCVSNR